MAEAEAESVVDLAEVVVEQEVEDLGRVARVEAFLDWVLLGASARVVMGAQQAEAVRVAVVAAVAEVMGSAKLVVEMVVEEEEVALEEEETAPVALDWVVVVDSGQVDTLEGRTVAVTQVANVEERGAAAKEDKTAAVGSEAGEGAGGDGSGGDGKGGSGGGLRGGGKAGGGGDGGRGGKGG